MKKDGVWAQVPKLTKEEIMAIKQLAIGEANPGQQTLALSVIVKKFAQPQDLLYSPGAFDETAFLNGRAFVGHNITRTINMPIGKLENQDNG